MDETASKTTASPTGPGAAGKAGATKKRPSKRPPDQPTEAPGQPAPPPDPQAEIGPLEVLRETFPGLATLLVVAVAVLAGAIALAVGQPYQHRAQATAWTELDFWLERQPAGDNEPGFLARADFYPRPADGEADSPPVESTAVTLLPETTGNRALLALTTGALALRPGSPLTDDGQLANVGSLAYSAAARAVILVDGSGSIFSLRATSFDRTTEQNTADDLSALGKTILTPDNSLGDYMQAVAISAAGESELFVAVDDNGAIASIDIAAKALAPRSRRETGIDLDSVAITPRATHGVAGAADGRLVLFTPQSDAKQALLTVDAHDAPVGAVAIADDGATIVSADAGGRVRIGNGDGDRISVFEAGAGLAGVALSADGARVLTAGADGRLRLWGRDGAEIGGGQRLAGDIRAIAATPALDYVAVAGSGLEAHRFDLVQLNTRLSWFALLAFALAGGLFYAFVQGFVRAAAWLERQRAAAEPAPAGRVRAFLTSDGPVSDPRYAGKALNELATRLFRFLANRDTAAPVTLALTAEWGMGKSSAMRLLQRRLEEQGMPTIWFNAWHHQKEEQLFASLMEQIRRYATPGISRPQFFHPRNLRVRLRLLRMRLVDRPLRGLLFLGLLAFLVTVLADAPTSLVDFSIDTVKALGAAGAAFIAFQNLFKPFAQNPLNLVQSWGGWFAPTRFKNLLGVRDQFAEAFDEVSRALGRERRLTIFIDDLDRCQKQQVVDVLEAVNFLVSTTECYIVLGISERPVKNAVGLMFKELAAAHALDSRDDGAARDDDAAAEDERVQAIRDQQRFADSYLEKLINISIAIPPFDTEALRHWLEVSETAPEEDAERTASRPLLRALAWSVRALAVGAVLAVAIVAGSRVDLDAEPTAPTATAAPAPSVVEDPPAVTGPAGGVDGPAGGTGSALPQTAGAVRPPSTDAVAVETSSLADWLDWRRAPLALLALLALALLAFAPPRARRWLGEVAGVRQPIADLDAFKRAMEIYLPVVLEARRSPRAIKRFVNRMRFLTAGLDESDADRVAGLIAIATAHEVGLIDGRDSSPTRARVELKQRIGAGIAVAEINTWTAETWETYWDLFASASFGDGSDGDDDEADGAPAAAAP